MKNIINLKLKEIKNKIYIQNHDFFFLIIYLILIIFLSFSNLIYPFNRYIQYSKEASVFIQFNFPNLLYSIFFFFAYALLFIFWFKYSPSLVKIIVPLAGFFFYMVGPLSLNQIYSTDSIAHVGILESILKRIPIPLKKRIHYPGLLFYYFLVPFAYLTSSYTAVLYIIPIFNFLLSVPLGNFLIEKLNNFKHKIFFGISFYIFPFYLEQKYSSTPYSLLISLFTLILYFILSKNGKNKRKKENLALFFGIISFLIHIHGIFIIYLILVNKASEKYYPMLKKYLISNIFFSISYILTYLFLLFSKYIKIKGKTILTYIYSLNVSVINDILYSITKPGGWIYQLFIPKLMGDIIFALWYIIQFSIFLFMFIFISYLFYIIFSKNNKIKIFNLINENPTLKTIIPIAYNLIILLTFGLFFSFNIQLWRLMYFLIPIGIYAFIFLFHEFILNFNIKWLFIFLFFYLFIAPFIIYIQYTPYFEEEINYINDFNEILTDENDMNNIIFTDKQTFKLIWALFPEKNVTIWEDKFWTNYNQSFSFQDFFNFHNNSLVNIFILFSAKTLARELQFNQVNLLNIGNEISESENANWIYQYRGNYILQIN